MTVFPKEFSGFAREITGVVRPNLLGTKTARNGVSAPRGPDHQRPISEDSMTALRPDTPLEAGVQQIPVIGFDEPSSRRTFAEYSALMRAARDAPSLYESVGFRRMIDHRRKAFLAAFGVLA